MWTFLDLLIFSSGFGACWLSKDRIMQIAAGTEAFAKMLETKAAALRALL